MMSLNFKSVTSAFAALAVTFALSWTFVDATTLARMHQDSSGALLAAISALVR